MLAELSLESELSSELKLPELRELLPLERLVLFRFLILRASCDLSSLSLLLLAAFLVLYRICLLECTPSLVSLWPSLSDTLEPELELELELELTLLKVLVLTDPMVYIGC